MEVFFYGSSLYEYKNNTIISSFSSTQCFDVSDDGLVSKQLNYSPFTITGLSDVSNVKISFDMDYVDSKIKPIPMNVILLKITYYTYSLQTISRLENII